MAEVFTDDFTGTDGSFPSQWTDLSDATVADPEIDTNQLLLHGVNGGDVGRVQATGVSIQDGELLFKFVPGTGDLVAHLRSSGSYSSGSDVASAGYALTCAESGNTNMTLWVLDPQSQIGSGTRANSNPHWVRFQVDGTTIRVRWWEVGNSEPGTWDISVTDSTYGSAGSVELTIWHNYTTGAEVRADDVAIEDFNLVEGSGAATEANDTAAGSGTVGGGSVSGSGAITEANDTATGAGEVEVSGAAAAAENPDVASGAGSVEISGSGSTTETNDTAAGTGTTAISGSGAIVEEDDTAYGTDGDGYSDTYSDTYSGGSSVSGGGSITEAGDTASGVGNVVVTGSGSVVEVEDTASGTGSVLGAITGSGAVTEADDAAAGLGATGSIQGAGASAAADDSMAGRGHVTIHEPLSYKTIDRYGGGFGGRPDRSLANPHWRGRRRR